MMAARPSTRINNQRVDSVGLGAMAVNGLAQESTINFCPLSPKNKHGAPLRRGALGRSMT